MDNSKQEPKNPIGDFDSIEEFTKNGFNLIVNATKAVNTFPSGASRDSYCAYPAFGKVVDSQSDRILGIISQVLINQNVRGNIQRRQQDEKFELLMDCNDLMLERINSNLDEAAGIRKNPETVLVQTSISTSLQANRNAGSWNYETKKSVSPNASPISASARLITAKNIARPQISFKTPVDNSPNTPFVPRITEKPNSLKPLAVLPEYGEDGQIESYLHPYEFELMKFEPSNDQLKRTDPQKPPPVLKTPLIYVDDEQKLTEMLADLRQSKEIAVDVEHHSYRTFQGFACLMQISTRKTDYIIDALKLREELHVLNEVFTNPKVVKILHGAECDVEWLQRDLSLYLVNMFDTYQAIKLLNFPRLSLAYLLKHYCGIEADKTFQLADWRIRPLPEELLAYARQDTHFLIYIYERLVNDLLDQANGNTNLLKTVYSKSADVCKRRYVKSVVLPDSHLDIHRKSRRIFDNRQLFALKEIFQWRDKIARLEDESYGYVLPNHMMLQIAESLPREMQGILACCNPIPPLVRQNLHALHQIVLKAREQSLVKPIIDEQIVHRATVSFAKDYNSSLHCPHDLSRNPEFRDDLPTLLGQQLLISNPPLIDLGVPKVTVFETSDNCQDESWNEKLQSLRREKFISPYDRYKETIPIAEKQRLEEIAKEEAINRAKLLCPLKAEKTVEANIQIKTEKPDDSTDLPIKEMARRKRANQENKNATSPKEKKAKVESAAENNLTNDSLVEEADMDKANGESPTETDSLIEPDSQTKGENPSQNRQNKKKFNNKKRKHLPQNKTGQSSNQAVQFDYSKVDFKKFQGGSQKAKGTEIQTNFHAKGKGNKANNKKFNKLFTFGGNVNKKK